MDDCRWILPLLQAIAKEREFKSEKFSCFICGEVWISPATVPCGHTFCMDCICDRWDRERGCSCPQCRQSFSPRPRLFINTTLQLDVRGLRDRVKNIVYAEPGEITCDVCPGKKRKAVKTCMGCRISYCETHVWAHLNKEPYTRHKLVEPGINLKDNVCPVHHEYITLFCCSDQQVLCPTCAARQHRDLKIMSSAAEMEHRKAVMVTQRKSYTTRLQHLTKEQEKVEDMIRVAGRVGDTEIIGRSASFMGFIGLLEKRQSEVEKEIRARKSTVQKLQKTVEQELLDLKTQQMELDSLSLTNSGQFLSKYKNLPELKIHTLASSTSVFPGFTDITEALSDLTKNLQPCTNMGLALAQNKLLVQQPMSREQYLQHGVNISLEPNTAHRRLVLSEENRRVSSVKKEQDYPPHPDRFRATQMVMSSQELSGRCYFEVQWFKPSGLLGITYKNICRKAQGKESYLGMNDFSWALNLDGNDVFLLHNGEKMEVVNPSFKRVCKIGVFLDHTAGIVSYFGVCQEEMFLFAKVHASFRKPLFVAVRLVGGEDSLEFQKLK